jgi:hypothetical protein
MALDPTRSDWSMLTPRLPRTGRRVVRCTPRYASPRESHSRLRHADAIVPERGHSVSESADAVASDGAFHRLPPRDAAVRVFELADDPTAR